MFEVKPEIQMLGGDANRFIACIKEIQFLCVILHAIGHKDKAERLRENMRDSLLCIFDNPELVLTAEDTIYREISGKHLPIFAAALSKANAENN